MTAGHSQAVIAVYTSQYCWTELKGNAIKMKTFLETDSKRKTKESVILLLNGAVGIVTALKRLRY